MFYNIEMDKGIWMQKWKSLVLLVTNSEDITEEMNLIC